MRIIGGEARGRRLIAPDGFDTRPTADKTREALFSILMREVPGAHVLDLFAGTGALALEALSRGAESAVMCDFSPKAKAAILRNTETVLKGRTGAEFIYGDYKKALAQLAGRRFDIVFLDPPYALNEAYAYTLSFLQRHNMLSEDGIIIAERAKDRVLELPEYAVIYDSRTYRDTCLDFIRLETSDEGDVPGQL
ncbi:MAG: 16S rRNA (guanine(966)-N(2))-methyltransferase RsmD [Clostridia bacterium]|nr:16S rRNA (guanine(966)-N(2))-methyltransferase RsmD [Clostridia bacterium]